MSTASLDQTTTVADGGFGAGDSPPTDRKPSSTGDRLYRIVWRWHFYAGMIIAPVLIVVAATGALYIFKDELEGVIYPGVTYVEPAAERVSYEQQKAAALAGSPATPRVVWMQVFTNPKRATNFVLVGNTTQYTYVDPYRGKFLGSIVHGQFFDDVLDLHRTLFLGTRGRIVVELTTCWTIVLAATGIYLWWPHKANQVWGVWLPRLRRKPYVVLRDLHSVGGTYVALVAILIALTGLIYTLTWGRVFQYASQKTDAYAMFSKPMISKSPPEAKDVSLDKLVEIAQRRISDNNLTFWFPRTPNGVFLVAAFNDRGPQVNRMLFVDRASGEIMEDRRVSQNKAVYQIGVWNYALHVGSVWGMPSKILWLITCIVLMTLPVTGVWMWWERRPRGRLGLPRRVDARRPRWLIATIVATSILLPTVGASVVVLLAGELVVSRLRRLFGIA
jgi:uncharacterized iron-regulated membrane protein